MYKIIIPGELPSMNEIIEATKKPGKRRNYKTYSTMKKDNTKFCAFCARRDLKNKTFKKIYLKITYICKNRNKDMDNIAAAKKFIFDGLVVAGVIENDGWKQIEGWQESFEVDSKHPRIIVEIEEVE